MRALLGLAGTIVVVLVGLNLYVNLKPAPKAMIDQPLTQLLPKAPPGWMAQDESIADTPEELEKVEGVLHYDDAAYRIYGDGHAEVAVYIAHWLPGKFSPAKVGAHSPDTCWVHNGWDMLERNQGVERPLAGGVLKPMETGVFEKDGQRVHVIFWHLVGGTPMQYDLVGWTNGIVGRIQRLPTLWDDFSKFGLDQRKEQLVIRLSSNISFEDLWSDPGFGQFMDNLCRSFGLYSKLPPAADLPAGAKVVGAI
jgi:hypothetical protein